MASDLPKNGSKSRKDSADDLHEQACQRGEHLYLDPELGLWVTTRVAHLERGYCCKNGCRHCPYRD